jgi:hypothetical protein
VMDGAVGAYESKVRIGTIAIEDEPRHAGVRFRSADHLRQGYGGSP